MEVKLQREYFHLTGFEVTRKVVLEGDRKQMPDILHELGDILAELGDDDIKCTGLMISNNDKIVKLTATLTKEAK